MTGPHKATRRQKPSRGPNPSAPKPKTATGQHRPTLSTGKCPRASKGGNWGPEPPTPPRSLPACKGATTHTEGPCSPAGASTAQPMCTALRPGSRPEGLARNTCGGPGFRCVCNPCHNPLKICMSGSCLPERCLLGATPETLAAQSRCSWGPKPRPLLETGNKLTENRTHPELDCTDPTTLQPTLTHSDSATTGQCTGQAYANM